MRETTKTPLSTNIPNRIIEACYQYEYYIILRFDDPGVGKGSICWKYVGDGIWEKKMWEEVPQEIRQGAIKAGVITWRIR